MHTYRALKVFFSQGKPPPYQDQSSGYSPQKRSFAPQTSENTTSTTIFVGNVSFQSNEDSIAEFFSECGTVTQVRIAMGEDGRPRGFAHVEFEDNESAHNAMKLAGQDMDGRPVRVDISEPRRGGGGGDRGNIYIYIYIYIGGRGGGFRGGNRGGGFRGGSRGGGRGGGRGRGGGFSTNKGSIQEYKGSKTTF